MSREAKFTQWVEILLINGFGWFTGFLIEQERKATRRLENTLEIKEILVEKLKIEAQERQRLEAEVRRSERLTALGQLSTGLAHEIRNPLGIIRVTTQLLSEEKQGDQTIAEYCRVLQEETSRLNRMLTDFLDFARPKEPIRQDVDLGELVQEGIQLVKPLFEEEGIFIQTNLTNIMNVQVEVDKDQIKQMILNLLLNALDAQKESGTTENTILIEGIKRKEGWGFVILDNGPGIPDQMLGDIFNPFFTTKEKGTGLGLSIVYRIIEQHQGRINLTNRPSGGVRAEVLFPR
jgi:signal transduction histidine kinase